MKHLTRLFLFALSMLGFFLTTGCTTGIQDGMRVDNTSSTIYPSGFVTSAPTAGAKMFVEARHPVSGAWVVIRDHISIGSDVSWTTKDGTKLYFWDAGGMTIPAEYWKAGTGGSFARVRVQWFNGTSTYNTLMARDDWGECFFEDFNGQGNTIGYMGDNCFSHRGEAYIYTANYREGSLFCWGPSSTTVKTHGHYMIDQLPSCAQSIVSNHMREKLDETTILMHYEINHDTGNSESQNALPDDHHEMCSMQPGSNGSCELGGFFGGHQRYIRRIERHVMVYDYPWMPKGKIPAWAGNTTIPTSFRDAQVSPNGNCDSYQSTCNGWRSDPITNASPGVSKPTSAWPGTVCSFANADAVASAVMTWHNNGHTYTGGHFGVFDSPANPLFFLWHNAINDVWRDYLACPRP